MKTIKVIDLLNKIANGEEVPKEIEYSRKYYYLTNNHDIDEFGSTIGMFNLNDEILILDEDYIEDTPKEDKKIEKLSHLNSDYYYKNNTYGAVSSEEIVLDIKTLENWINKIIDKVNGE